MAQLKMGKYRVRVRGLAPKSAQRKRFKLTLPKIIFGAVVVLPAITPSPAPTPSPNPKTSPLSPPAIVISESVELDSPADLSIIADPTIRLTGSVTSNDPKRNSIDVVFSGRQPEEIALDENRSFAAAIDIGKPGAKTLEVSLGSNNSISRNILIPRQLLNFDSSDEDWKIESQPWFPIATENQTAGQGPESKRFLAGIPETNSPNGVDIVFLVDISRSMERTMKLPWIREAIGKQIVESLKGKLPGDVRYGLVFFSDNRRGELLLKYPAKQTSFQFA